MALKVLRAGILSTLQDLGRWGYQRFGVPVSGAMDEVSHRLANLLVGNDESEATVEMTLVGPGFTVTRDTLIAVCGGDFEARITGERLPRARPVVARAGGTVDFGACRHGCRAYLAVGGGFALEPVLGSRSTYLRGGFGGFRGRALKRGDLLPTGEADASLYPGLWRKLRERRAGMAYPSWSVSERVELLTPGPYLIRFVPGRHWQCFSAGARERFVGGDYRIGSNSDRQGYRLEGPTAVARSAHRGDFRGGDVRHHTGSARRRAHRSDGQSSDRRRLPATGRGGERGSAAARTASAWSASSVSAGGARHRSGFAGRARARAGAHARGDRVTVSPMSLDLFAVRAV